MAYFCSMTGLPPSEFKKLTYLEYKYFIQALKERVG